jgi:hypothetical protein
MIDSAFERASRAYDEKQDANPHPFATGPTTAQLCATIEVMQHSTRYHPDFERALEALLIAATDSAEFATEKPLGRSRTASLRRLAHAIAELHSVSARIVLASRVPAAGSSQAHDETVRLAFSPPERTHPGA